MSFSGSVKVNELRSTLKCPQIWGLVYRSVSPLNRERRLNMKRANKRSGEPRRDRARHRGKGAVRLGCSVSQKSVFQCWKNLYATDTVLTPFGWYETWEWMYIQPTERKMLSVDRAVFLQWYLCGFAEEFLQQMMLEIWEKVPVISWTRIRWGSIKEQDLSWNRFHRRTETLWENFIVSSHNINGPS